MGERGGPRAPRPNGRMSPPPGEPMQTGHGEPRSGGDRLEVDVSARTTVVVGALAVLTGLGAALPELSPVTSLAVHAGALAAVADGVRRHRPVVPRAWTVVLVLLAVGLAGSATGLLTDLGPTGARWSALAVPLVALGLLPHLVRTLRTGSAGRTTWPDVFLTVCGAALVVVQVLGMLADTGLGDRPAVLVGTAADVLLVIALLRVLSTRAGLAPTTVLVLLATGLLLAVAGLLGSRGELAAQHAPALRALQTVAALLLATAAQHPSMRHLGCPYAGGHLRTDGQRLLSVVPVLCAVPVLWLLGLSGVLPDVAVEVVVPSGYVLACVGVALAAIALRRAEKAADHDPLTDLVNRRGLPVAVARLRQRHLGRDLHLCLVDLDDFKQINDTRGHAVGDALLVEVAERVRRAVGAHGVVSRTGGDEFIVVVWTPPEDEDGPGDLVLTALDAPFDTAGLPYQVSASVGIAPLPAGVALEQALVDADVAMYAAKQAGKGRSLVYRPQLREKVLGGLVRQQELRQLLLHGAPAAEVGELVVVHQPIVSLTTGRMTGTEALVRWHHPRAGLLVPDEFLPHAEAAGLGARLDEHVAAAAVRHLAHWDSLGLPQLDLAVNLGVGSLHRRGTARWVTALVEAHGIAPHRIHLEITEHEELPDDPHIAASLRDCVTAGFRIDLDDFGIGYTSLSYMRRFPVSTVKLDRSLTTLVAGGGDVPLLEGIAALCRALDMDMLAEGVESQAQVEPLRRLGVGSAQGHHFGMPMDADDVPGFVRRTLAGAGGDVDGALVL